MLFAVVEQGAPGSDPPANALAPAWLDREAMMERLGGDADLFADVVDLFLEDCPPHVAAIEAAVDARDADRPGARGQPRSSAARDGHERHPAPRPRTTVSQSSPRGPWP